MWRLAPWLILVCVVGAGGSMGRALTIGMMLLTTLVVLPAMLRDKMT